MILRILLLYMALIITVAADSYNDSNTNDHSSSSLNYRLPDKVVEPLHYDINIMINYSQRDPKFSGESVILISIKHRTRHIYLHAYNLLINENRTMLCQYGDSIKYEPDKHIYNDKTQILHLEFNEEIKAGIYELYMAYSGNITYDAIGFFKVRYLDENGNERSVFMTQMKPMGARRVFPCWDEPAMKATFHISVRHPQNYRALSNMQVENRRNEVDTAYTHFAITPHISSCQLAIVIMDLTDTSSETYQYGVIWHRSQVADQIDHSRIGFQSSALDLLSTLNINNYAMKQKMDYITIPNLPYEAMMNLGLFVYREEYYTNNGNLMINDNIELSIVTTYKMTYQWIFNVVSPSWWTQLWLTKALATFFQQLILSKLYADPNMRNFFIFRGQELAFNKDHTSNIESYTNGVNTPDDINKLYSSSCCMKETVLMRMLENIITEDVFRNGIAKYFEAHEFNSATVDDFWIALQTALDESTVPHDTYYDIKEIMDSWLMQKYYPVVNVKRDYTTGDVIITQEHSNAKKKPDNNIKWWIPITYIAKSNPKFYKNMLPMHWLTPQNHVITLKEIDLDDWVIVNLQYTGYYRVNYDLKNWDRIVEYLFSEKYENIPELNRAHLIDDAFYFLMQDQFNTEMFTLLVSSLGNEKSFAPWYAINRILSDLWDISVFQRLESYVLQKCMLMALNQRISSLGYEENKDDEDSVKLVRLIATQWACRFNNTECRRTATTKLQAHLQNPKENIILPWWKEWTYCAGLMETNISVWHEVMMEYASTRDKEILIYLTCSEDPAIINYYLESYLIKNSEATRFIRLNPSDHRKVFMSILKKHLGKSGVLQYIIEHINQLIPTDMTMKEGLSHVLHNIHNMKDLNAAESFVMDYYYKELAYDEVHKMMISCEDKKRERNKILSVLNRKDSMHNTRDIGYIMKLKQDRKDKEDQIEDEIEDQEILKANIEFTHKYMSHIKL